MSRHVFPQRHFCALLDPQPELSFSIFSISMFFYYFYRSVLLILTAVLASYTITMLLHSSLITGLKSFEGIAHKAFGWKGKLATSIVIILHCLGGKRQDEAYLIFNKILVIIYYKTETWCELFVWIYFVQFCYAWYFDIHIFFVPTIFVRFRSNKSFGFVPTIFFSKKIPTTCILLIRCRYSCWPRPPQYAWMVIAPVMAEATGNNMFVKSEK